MINVKEYLINDLKSFAEESIQQKPSVDSYTVDRKQYFNLMNRVDAITNSNFKSYEGYDFFQRFVNQPQRLSDRIAFERNFIDNRLYGGYLWMIDYIYRIAERLKEN